MLIEIIYQVLIDGLHTFLITTKHENEKKRKEKATLTPATCLLHLHPASLITILCANIATLWLLLPLFIYLFIFGGVWRGGGRGCNNVSHLDIINWVVFGMAQSLEIFKYSCL